MAVPAPPTPAHAVGWCLICRPGGEAPAIRPERSRRVGSAPAIRTIGSRWLTSVGCAASGPSMAKRASTAYAELPT
jgi:hypothetical protein